MEHETAIQTSDLSKDYGHRSILRELNFQALQCQIIALLGANGAGKTTFLRCLASLVRPTSGQILWFGVPAGASPARRKLVGMVTHDSQLYIQLTLRENLVFAARMYDVAEPHRRADRMLERVGLLAHAGRLPTEISQGMRQRVAIARALLHEPRILLLDEPYSSLDTDGCRWLTQTLRERRAAGHTICFATHDESKAGQLADAVFELRSGQLQRLRTNKSSTIEVETKRMTSTRNRAA